MVDEELEARVVAQEVILRSILTGTVLQHQMPLDEVERMATHFRNQARSLRVDGGDPARAERIHAQIVGTIEETFAWVRGAVIRQFERQAARSTKN